MANSAVASALVLLEDWVLVVALGIFVDGNCLELERSVAVVVVLVDLLRTQTTVVAAGMGCLVLATEMETGENGYAGVAEEVDQFVGAAWSCNSYFDDALGYFDVELVGMKTGY